MKYRYLLSLILIPLLLLQACEQNGGNSSSTQEKGESSSSKPQKEATLSSPEQQEVKKYIDALVEAFNKHDIHQLSDLWIDQPYFINLTTEESFDNKNALADYYKRLFGSGADQIHVKISSLSFPAPNEAIAKGLAEIEYKDKHTEKRAFSTYYVKENGKWLIQNFTVNEINPPSSHHEELKALDWLVGNWVDEDENIDIYYTFEWDKNKNFLTQYFTVNILGEEQLSGIQVFGWDPNEKKIRSWTFDSDGGFGSSTLTQNDNIWNSDIVFTLPQGGTATATHVYRKVDDNTYTFTLEKRVIDGKSLPDIGPFKVVRKK